MIPTGLSNNITGVIICRFLTGGGYMIQEKDSSEVTLTVLSLIDMQLLALPDQLWLVVFWQTFGCLGSEAGPWLGARVQRNQHLSGKPIMLTNSICLFFRLDFRFAVSSFIFSGAGPGLMGLVAYNVGWRWVRD